MPNKSFKEFSPERTQSQGSAHDSGTFWNTDGNEVGLHGLLKGETGMDEMRDPDPSLATDLPEVPDSPDSTAPEEPPKELPEEPTEPPRRPRGRPKAQPAPEEPPEEPAEPVDMHEAVFQYVCRRLVENLKEKHKSEIYQADFASKLFDKWLDGETCSQNPLLASLMQECLESGVSDPYLADLTKPVMEWVLDQ